MRTRVQRNKTTDLETDEVLDVGNDHLDEKTGNIGGDNRDNGGAHAADEDANVVKV